MKSLFAASLLLLACPVVAWLAQDVEPQPEPPVRKDRSIDEVFKLHDTDKNGSISWDELLELHEKKDSQDNVLPPLEYLVADANRDLQVDRTEYAAHRKLALKAEAPNPELWHHKQLAQVGVDRTWEQLSRLPMVTDWDLDDSDWDGDDEEPLSVAAIKIEFEDYPWQDSSKYATKADLNKDGKLSKDEYVSFKAFERLDGWWVNESAQVVDYCDAFGKLIASSADATPPQSFQEHDTDGMKPGASWVVQVRTTGDDWHRFRYELIYLNCKWSSGAESVVKEIPVHQYIKFEGDKFWLRGDVYLVAGQPALDAPKGSVRGGERWYAYASTLSFDKPEGAEDKLHTVTVPAGTIETARFSREDGGHAYAQVVGGVLVDVLWTDATKKRTQELISLSK